MSLGWRSIPKMGTVTIWERDPNRSVQWKHFLHNPSLAVEISHNNNNKAQLPREEGLRAGGALVWPNPLSPVDLLVASCLKESQKCLKTNVKLDL